MSSSVKMASQTDSVERPKVISQIHPSQSSELRGFFCLIEPKINPFSHEAHDNSIV